MPILSAAARTTLVCLSALIAASCGGGAADPEAALTQGYNALARGDGRAALPLLESAAAELATDPSAPRWKEIQIALIEAEARVDAERGKERFLALARKHRGRFAAEDFAMVGGKLFQVGASLRAIDVLHAGIEEFQLDDPRLHRVLKDIEAKARAEGDAATMSTLAGLGYLCGGDDDEFDDGASDGPR
jgi:hypothetical protein